MTTRRDYKAEYAQRIARGSARGLSRSQARGHPRPSEAYVSAKHTVARYEPLLERGLKEIRTGRLVQQAARFIGVAPERLRAYLMQTGVVQKHGRRLRVIEDPRLRQIPFY